MAFSKARRLGDLITANAEQFITSAHITDTAITGSDIHSTFDLTGKTVTVATASAGDNDTSAASTAFVQQEIASLVDSAPGTLNTLNELAAALGDDANFSTTVTNSIATKLPLAGGTLTGALTAPQLTVDNVGINGDTITLTGSTASGFIQTSTNVFQIGTSTNDRIDIFANNAVRATILGDGKVGIGTSSPGTILHTRTSDATSNNNAGGGFYHVSSSTAGNRIASLFLDADNGNFSTSSDGAYAYIEKIGGGGNLNIRNQDNSPIIFYRSSSESMRIDGSGNVGIGLSNPSAYGKLAVSGTATQLALNASSGKSRIGFFEAGTGRFYLDTLNGADGLAFVDADGSTERMRIDASGDVGIGTTNPVHNLHVKDTSSHSTVRFEGANNNYKSTLLISSTSSGDAGIQYDASNNTYYNFSYGDMNFNVGSGNLSGSYPANQRMIIKAGGMVYMNGGTGSFGTPSFTDGILFTYKDDNEPHIENKVNHANSFGLYKFNNSNGAAGSISMYSTSVSYNTSSDYRLKEDVNYTWDATSKLKQLKPCEFKFKADSDDVIHQGFLAHEVDDIVPTSVFGEKDGEEMQQLDNSKLVPLLVKTIQELEARIETLEG